MSVPACVGYPVCASESCKRANAVFIKKIQIQFPDISNQGQFLVPPAAWLKQSKMRGLQTGGQFLHTLVWMWILSVRRRPKGAKVARKKLHSIRLNITHKRQRWHNFSSSNDSVPVRTFNLKLFSFIWEKYYANVNFILIPRFGTHYTLPFHAPCGRWRDISSSPGAPCPSWGC